MRVEYITHPLCQQCQSPIIPTYRDKPSRVRKYCSRTCTSIGRQRRQPRACAYCNTIFSVRPSRPNAKCCSHPCASAYRRQTLADRLARYTDRSGDCWEWTGGQHSHGYGKIDNRGAHTVAWELATGTAPPRGYMICHTCDNPACVRNDEPGTYAVGDHFCQRVGHLFLGTPSDNMTDRAAKGRAPHGDGHIWRQHPERRPRGSAHGNAKLTEAQVAVIKQQLRSKIPHRTIAEAFGVSRRTISIIAQGRGWQHVA